MTAMHGSSTSGKYVHQKADCSKFARKLVIEVYSKWTANPQTVLNQNVRMQIQTWMSVFVGQTVTVTELYTLTQDPLQAIIVYSKLFHKQLLQQLNECPPNSHCFNPHDVAIYPISLPRMCPFDHS